jgi:hypothetical protein
MTLSHNIPITITQQQILDFANLTADNSAIHIEGGVVQGGLILSMLPYWSKIAIELNNFPQMFNDSMTVKMNCKFSNPLIADTPVNITFDYTPLKFRISKISWVISGDIEYCSGDWIIYSLS